MATIGRVLLIPKGDYNASATYNSLDWVRYNGCAWVCKVNGTVGVVPTETAPEWQVLAKDGNVSGSIAWIDITGKPFNGVGNGLNVDGSNNIELDINMLTGSNISYDNSDSGLSANDIQSAIDELAGSSTDVSWNQIQGATGSTKIAEIEIDGTTQEVYAPTGGGGGMFPYLYIDSEAGATVTVNQPDGTTITPTAAGSGHWECELTGGYGTYVIHSVLSGQGDATLSLAVDTVKEYHVTDTHYDYTINVTAPSGSSIRITGGGETYTETGTGSSQAFAVHTPSTTYTVAVTMDGNTKSETITSAATSGQSGSVTIAFGTINLTYANDFRGKTITCTKSGVTVTKTAPSSGNTMTFRVPTTGTWTISGTVSGTAYSVEANVTSLSTAVSADLQTTQNITADLYSAANDTVTYTDEVGTKTCVTDANGHGTATIQLRASSSSYNVTFTSSVAKDPDNLSNVYSKTVSVTPSTTEIYVMPDNVLYWWGYYSPNLEDMTDKNGWNRSGYTFTAPTRATQYLDLRSSGSTNNSGVGTKTTKSASNVYAITEGVTAYNSNYMMIGAYGSKTIVGSSSLTKYKYVTNSSLSKNNIGGSVASGNYLFCYCGATQESKLYAFWYD